MAQSRCAFIKADWHAEIVDNALVGFQQVITDIPIDVFSVPGAFEMPLFARDLARTGKYDAIVAAALVVDGGIYRHEFVAQAVVNGLMQAGLETGVPVYSVSLTPHNYQETDHHSQPHAVSRFSAFAEKHQVGKCYCRKPYIGSFTCWLVNTSSA